jgi:hypothetical protein
MNCKQGDMAIVTRTETGRGVGMVVTCLALLNDPSVRFIGLGPIWIVDSFWEWEAVDGSVRSQPWMMDRWLMPISPDAHTVADESVSESTI